MKPRKCPRCGFVNSSVAVFCNRCDLALDAETAMRIDGIRKRDDAAVFKILNDPEIQEFIARKLVEKGLAKELAEAMGAVA